MESTHQPNHSHEHRHGPQEDWNSEEYVEYWIERQEGRAAERHRHFVIVRALMPKAPDQEFRYLNLGAGPGHLDAVLLEHFRGAQATLVDGSFAMLGAARQQLDRFEDRVEFVQGNLASPEWTGAVGGTFDIVLSTFALHHAGGPSRLRELYGEVYRLLGHGGMFLNLEFVRSARPSLVALGPWAAKDPEARLSGRIGGMEPPGTMIEQLGWLSEAGFACADVFWRELNTALIGGIRDHLHLPESEHPHAAEGSHTHS